MVRKHEQAEPNDDVARLLQDTYASPPLRAEFVATLGEALDTAFESGDRGERIAQKAPCIPDN